MARVLAALAEWWRCKAAMGLPPFDLFTDRLTALTAG